MEYLDSVGEFGAPRVHGFEGLAFFVSLSTIKILGNLSLFPRNLR